MKQFGDCCPKIIPSGLESQGRASRLLPACRGPLLLFAGQWGMGNQTSVGAATGLRWGCRTRAFGGPVHGYRLTQAELSAQGRAYLCPGGNSGTHGGPFRVLRWGQRRLAAALVAGGLGQRFLGQGDLRPTS